jgi:hypothetical protein
MPGESRYTGIRSRLHHFQRWIRTQPRNPARFIPQTVSGKLNETTVQKIYIRMKRTLATSIIIVSISILIIGFTGVKKEKPKISFTFDDGSTRDYIKLQT